MSPATQRASEWPFYTANKSGVQYAIPVEAEPDRMVINETFSKVQHLLIASWYDPARQDKLLQNTADLQRDLRGARIQQKPGYSAQKTAENADCNASTLYFC
uniref:Uncharacterized protein n=1 Tax=Lactobacillus delbrueckii subsp. bulgaricus TaxID=1585 RepID=Q9L6G7_LACDE|nr:unknown [Lactobacillus delbrueckii subsp. bulgaricus]